jgi:hypothetical protein
MLNGAVGYQLLDDGTAVSIGLLLISSLLIFIGTGYIALDTGFSWTGYWDDTLGTPNQAYALYTLYQLVPLVFLVIFFLLEAFLVLRILGERKPMRKYSITMTMPTTNLIMQYTSLAPRSSSRSDKFSNTLSACTSALAQTARSTAVSSSRCSPCWL